MPKEKFDKKKLDSYKKMLMGLKENAVHDINNMAENKSSDGSDAMHVLHMADVATDMYDKEFNLGLASNEREILSRIDSALKKIDKKTFGACVECEKPIREVRLKAIPYVENCLKCQEKLENEG